MSPVIRVGPELTRQTRPCGRECTHRKFLIPRVRATYYLVSIAYNAASPRSVQGNYKFSLSPGAFKDFPGLSAPII